MPPRQQLVAADKWPIVGERFPAEAPSDWPIDVFGLVEQPVRLTLDELRALPQTTQAVDIHCVTRWSKPGVEFTGVRLADLLALAAPLSHARFVSFIARTERGHSTSLPLAAALTKDVLVALQVEGEPVPVEHGGPVRVVTPGATSTRA